MDEDSKVLLWTIGVVVLIFASFIGGKYLLKDPAGEVLTIDDLHQMNIDGKSSENNYMYNGFSFVRQNGLWYTQVQNNNTVYDIPLHFAPKDLEDIPINGTLDSRFFQKSVYITFNPLDVNMQYVALGSAELSLNLVKGLGIVPKAACDRNETETCIDREIITCESNAAAVYVKQAEEDKITFFGNCALIEGNGIGLVKSIDRFILLLYNIMP